MEITISDKIMRDGKVIEIKNRKKDPVPKIISTTIPQFIQD